MRERKFTVLASELRVKIQAGNYGWEGGLPEEAELARATGYARGTVRSALTLLEGEGLIIQKGRSYFVNKRPETQEK